MIIAMPFFLVRVLTVFWNILMFVENPKAWMTSLLCPRGACLDVNLDEQPTLFISLFAESYPFQTKGRLVL